MRLQALWVDFPQRKRELLAYRDAVAIQHQAANIAHRLNRAGTAPEREEHIVPAHAQDAAIQPEHMQHPVAPIQPDRIVRVAPELPACHPYRQRHDGRHHECHEAEEDGGGTRGVQPQRQRPLRGQAHGDETADADHDHDQRHQRQRAPGVVVAVDRIQIAGIDLDHAELIVRLDLQTLPLTQAVSALVVVDWPVDAVLAHQSREIHISPSWPASAVPSPLRRPHSARR